MRAVTYQGKSRIAVKEVAAPSIQDREDVIVRITSTAICGSDLHLYQGNFPLPIGYVIGHEPMGVVEEVGPDVTAGEKGRSCRHSIYRGVWSMPVLPSPFRKSMRSLKSPL